MSLAFSRLLQRSKYSNLRLTEIPPFRLACMNLRFSTFVSVLATSSAWIPTSKTIVSTTTPCQSPSLSFPPSRRYSDFSLKSTVAPEAEEVTSPALSPQGKPIADGHVVSSFKGGFVAIRVDDDIAEILAATPEVVDTTNLLPKDSTKSSLGGDLMGRQVVFENGHTGVVVTHRPPIAFVYTDMADVPVADIQGGVKVLDSLAKVDVDESRKAVDCFGRSLLTPGDITTSQKNILRPIFAPIPKISDISLINSPLLTGVTMFDALAPIGKGQNMLLVGHDIKDMRQYVCDILSVQAKQTKCIYASTSDNKAVVKILGDSGLSDDVVLVSSRESAGIDQTSMAAEATVTAATACAIAEALALEKGMDTLVIVDNIDQLKSLWDATTRVLVDVFGVDAVVKGDRDGGASSEMRAFFSSLIQRSAKYKEKKGGGSVTLLLLATIPKMVKTDEETVFSPDDFAESPLKVRERIDLLVKRNVPLTAATLRKIQIPVPTVNEGTRRLALQHIDDLISMSDGQIWLDEELEAKGRRPAMDFQRSVTRIGIGADTESRADAPAMRGVVEGLRLDLSQAGDMGGTDSASGASKKQARNALAWLLAMHQPSGASGARSLSESCAALLAASKGYLGDSIDNGVLAGTSEGETLMSELLEHVKTNAAEAMEAIDSTLDLTQDSREAIQKAIQTFFS
mmetsp:Transcript_107866/g.302043  ORF Transcript_107866/g.302043 Transcript_107866/m.302043 type:complete len:684 (-) Transcript_107866:38-2089(-)